MNEEEKKHKRRVRYSGTHPRKFEEKYKEHNPEKYRKTVEKVIAKGSTPAGMHISIMVNEVLEALQIKPGERGLDATLGYGGHSMAMLHKLQGQGHLYSLDVDPIESEKTVKRLRDAGFGENVFTMRRMNFANILDLAKEVGRFDFAMADLGVSSMQIDNPERGFSYKTTGPLDLRLDPTKGESAAKRLRSVTEEELVGMFIENSDEPYAKILAREIKKRNKSYPQIETTTDLKDTIEKALVFLPKEERTEAVKKSCQRVFQALRIDVNSEFEVLYQFLNALPDCLDPGGRVAILTFHSGEDRLVKQAFKEGKRTGIYDEISEEVIRPSKEECFRNPRAASTKLRFAIRSAK